MSSWRGETGIQRLVLADGRRIELPGLMNLRDVGGYPAGGGVLRWRALLRSDGLHRLDAGDAAVLAGIGLRTIVDLRTPAETQIAPSMLDGLAARLAHVPVLTGDLSALDPELESIYRHLIAECGAAIAAAVSELCAPAALPALVHCSAGKDRTGIVVALVLAALGVPDEVIAADYALSARYLDPERTPAIRQLQDSTGLGDALRLRLLASPPDLILSALDRARTMSGSAGGYLLDHGLSSAELARLRSALLA